MKALGLFSVFLLARVIVLMGRDVPLSPWSPVAYLWQDLLVVLLFGVLERAVRRPWFSWALYGGIVAYVALNLPLTRLLSSPMTVPMLRAARGTLADSILHHLTFANVALMALVAGMGICLPVLLRNRRLPRGVAACLAAGACVCVVAGPAATRRVDTGGLHRNVFAALITTSVPRLAAAPSEGDWRAGLFPQPDTGEDLSGLRGAAAGRNIVMILLESTGALYLKPYGATNDPMPHLTAVADQSILFENAYVVYPESIKGLFSVLCSRYPAFDTRPEVCAKVRTPSVAARLARTGYRTALFHSGRFAYLGMEEIVNGRGFQTLEDAGDIGGNRHSSFGVDEPATVQRMLGWIDSLSATDRFFITYLPVAGHHPYDTPEPGPFPAHDEPGRYLNALHYSDEALGAFFKGLQERGRYEQTLFVIFGDHGEAFGQHDGNYGHTLFLYEENVRVPYLIAAPGLVRSQIRVERMASLVDTAPTILELVGLTPPSEYQGSSLLDSRGRMALFFTDYSLGLLGLRDGNWKLIHELESGRTRLFDLAEDPGERHDRSEREPARTIACRNHLIRWAAAQRALILRMTDCPPNLRTPRHAGVSELVADRD